VRGRGSARKTGGNRRRGAVGSPRWRIVNPRLEIHVRSRCLRTVQEKHMALDALSMSAMFAPHSRETKCEAPYPRRRLPPGGIVNPAGAACGWRAERAPLCSVAASVVPSPSSEGACGGQRVGRGAGPSYSGIGPCPGDPGGRAPRAGRLHMLRQPAAAARRQRECSARAPAKGTSAPCSPQRACRAATRTS